MTDWFDSQSFLLICAIKRHHYHSRLYTKSFIYSLFLILCSLGSVQKKYLPMNTVRVVIELFLLLNLIKRKSLIFKDIVFYLAVFVSFSSNIKKVILDLLYIINQINNENMIKNKYLLHSVIIVLSLRYGCILFFSNYYTSANHLYYLLTFINIHTHIKWTHISMYTWI